MKPRTKTPTKRKRVAAPSPESTEAQGTPYRTHADALELVRQLQTEALRGNLSAVLALVDLAREATRAAHSLFGDATPPLRPSDYFKEQPFTDELERRDAMHYFIGTAQPFPVLHHFDRDSTPEAKAQATNLHTLKHGAFKGRARRDTPEAFWGFAHRDIESVRRGAWAPKGGWPKQAFDLPPLSPESVLAWANVAAEWYAANHLEKLQSPKLALHKFALIEHKKEQAKSIKRLEDRYENKKLNDWNERHGLPAEYHVPKRETDSVKARKPSLECLKRGLRFQFTKFLKANYKANHRPPP